jgi:hypothetical protein
MGRARRGMPARLAKPACGNRRTLNRPRRKVIGPGYSVRMSTHPTARPATPSADCAAILPGYQFADAYAVDAPPGLDAMEATKLAFGRRPLWIRALMGARDRLGRLAGLAPAPAGGFPVLRQSPGEVRLGFDDWHLDFRVVVTVAAGAVTLTTIVRWHNAWGRRYLALIMPFHRVIAARLIEGIA